MNEYKFAALVLCVLIFAHHTSKIWQSKLIAEAIKSGADPIQARCAIVGSDETNNKLCK